MNPINWQETYTNISPKLLGICRRYIKDLATAEDIVQDSFMVAIQKENTLKDINALNGWLSRIVINMAIHHLKETKKIIFSTSDNFEVVDNSTTMNTTELDNKSKLLASDLDRNDVLEAIDGLPEHHKSVFNMYVIDQFSHNQIAKTLDISVGTSKSHLSRARKAIQTFLLDKIKEKPVDKDKKRRIAFLIFLGFGNSMFANFYKLKFQDFEIVSKNQFSFAKKNVAVPNQFIGLTKALSFAKIAFIGVGFLLVLSVGFYIFNTNFIQNKVTEKKTNIVLEHKLLINNNPIINSNVDSPNIEKASIKTVSLIEKPDIRNETMIQNVISDRVADNPTLVSKKDSVVTEPKKIVVIKKQIIKRDTVYVTK
jgi:RNA polymerase sigma factor (sigma-70 family)